MTPAFKALEFFETRVRRDFAGKGEYVTTLSPVANAYYVEELPTIPAGTVIKFDFGGGFGFYGTADVNGVLHRVKVDLTDIHKVDFSELIAKYVDTP